VRVAALKNVSVEGLGNLRKSFEKRGFSVREFDAFKGEFPKLEDFDVLVVLGGPMGVYEDDKYPFLAEEKRLMEGALQEGKGILGICLGCQLLANVLGAPVYRGEWGKEIGWKPIYPQMDLELSLTKSPFSTGTGIPLTFQGTRLGLLHLKPIRIKRLGMETQPLAFSSTWK